MAIIKKVKLPDGTTHDVNDARITGIDNTPVQNSTNVVTSGGLYTELVDVVHQGDTIGSATYEDSGAVVDLTDYVREDNLKTINNQSLIGSGNITISGGSGGEANVIESITYDGEIVPITNKTANIVSNSHLHVTIDTENFLWDGNTLIQTDFTRTSLASFLGITISEVQLLYQGKYDFIEAEIVFYEDGESFSETWVIPRFFRSQSVSEPDVVYGVGADSWYDIQFSCSNHTIENGNYQILIGNGGNLESSYESTFNKVYSLSSSSTHSEYPSAKCVYDAIQNAGGGSSDLSNYYTKTESDNKYVPKSGTTEMSDNAVLSFSSEDWDEQNHTGYKTEISKAGIDCYDPDDGFELHLDNTGQQLSFGSYSGAHTTYGHGALTYFPTASSYYQYNFPSKSGTFAMTSDIPNLSNYVSKDGGSMNPNKSLTFTEGDLFYNRIKYDGIEMDNDDDGFYVEISSMGPHFKISQGASQNIFTKYTQRTIEYRDVDNSSTNPFVLSFPETSGTLAVTSNIPDLLSDLSDDSTHRLVTDTEKSTWNNKVSNVQSDWNATSGLAQILNKPTLATVATSGSYNDLSNKPTIPSAVTESTVSGWGFTKNTGTLTGVNFNGNSASVSNGVASITATIPTTTSALTNDSGFKKITISSSEPTSSDGVNGDIWIVI